MQSCCSPIASTSAAAPRVIASIRFKCGSPFASMLAVCVCFSCCFQLRPLQLLLLDCVHFNCCSLITSNSTAAPRLCPLRSASTAAPRLHPLQLLLAACVHFSCCSQSRPLQLLLPDCVHFNCYSPITSDSTVAPQLRPLQLLLPDCNCCSPTTSASAAAPRQLFWKIPAHVQCSRSFIAEFEVQ